MRGWSTRHRWFGAVLGAVVLLAIGVHGVATGARSAHAMAGQRPITSSGDAIATARFLDPAGTFVSLVPACACGRHTELELFSAATGRMLRRLAPVPIDDDDLATPAATNAGRLFLTYSSGPRCADTGRYVECPRFTPNSCRNVIDTITPGGTGLRPAFRVPDSETVVGSVAPSPDGRAATLMVTPCTVLRATTGLFVRDLRTGAERSVLTSTNRCDQFGPAAWSPNGDELVFPVDLARGRPIIMAGGIGCPEARNELGLSPTPGRSRRPAVRLIAPPRGCVFAAAAFDRLGIVAAEGCEQGDPQPGVDSYLGHAYVVQFSPHGRLQERLPIHLGLLEAIVATEPHTGHLLITEDQPANEPYPERDWVWMFDGHRLRPIAHYRADDAAQVLAIPW